MSLTLGCGTQFHNDMPIYGFEFKSGSDFELITVTDAKEQEEEFLGEKYMCIRANDRNIDSLSWYSTPELAQAAWVKKFKTSIYRNRKRILAIRLDANKLEMWLSRNVGKLNP